MPNRWTTFVKQWATTHKIAYGCALSNPDMKAEYYKRFPKKLTKKAVKAMSQLEESKPEGNVKSKVTYPNLKIKIPEPTENIHFNIEELEPEPDLKESTPSINPKLQMKGITIGTREIPKEESDNKNSFVIPIPHYKPHNREDNVDKYGNPIKYEDVKVTISLTETDNPLIEVTLSGKVEKTTYKKQMVIRNGERVTEDILDENKQPTIYNKKFYNFVNYRFYFNGIPPELIKKKGFRKAFETYYNPTIDKWGNIQNNVPDDLKGIRNLKTYVYVINWTGRSGGRGSSTFHEESQGVRFFARDMDKNLKEEDPLPEKWYKQIQSAGFKIHERQIPLEYRDSEEKKAERLKKSDAEKELKGQRWRINDYFKTLHTYAERPFNRNYPGYIPYTETEYLEKQGYTPDKINEISELFLKLASEGEKFQHVPKELKKEIKKRLKQNK